MAHLAFDYVDPSGPPYLNSNLWLSQSDPFSSDGQGHPVINFGDVVNSPLAEGTYHLNAIVSNRGSAPAENSVGVWFYLLDPSTQFVLAPPNPGCIFLGNLPGPTISNLDPDSNIPPDQQTWFATYSFKVNFGAFASKLQDKTHFCLVAVLQEGGVANTYMDGLGNLNQNVVANGNSQYLAQHNLTFVYTSNGLPGTASIKVVGPTDGSSSTLTIRPPDRVTFDAIVRSLGPQATGLEDLTTQSLAGFFDDGTDIRKTGVECLPQQVDLSDLEPGCVRNIGVGIQLPSIGDDGGSDESAPAAFWVVEQVRADGMPLGGVIVVGLSRERSSASKGY